MPLPNRQAGGAEPMLNPPAERVQNYLLNVCSTYAERGSCNTPIPPCVAPPLGGGVHALGKATYRLGAKRSVRPVVPKERTDGQTAFFPPIGGFADAHRDMKIFSARASVHARQRGTASISTDLVPMPPFGGAGEVAVGGVPFSLPKIRGKNDG